MRKRLFDVVVVVVTAIAWVPVVAVAALAVLLLSGRPVFYRSRRWVAPELAIRMVKLRVMVPDAHKVVAPVTAGRFLNTPANSPLYTPIGRVLDRMGLNEIPQFAHVLRGEMTIVGPRPLTEIVRECLLEQHPDLDERWANQRAGLTGLPQLVGRSELTDSQRLSLEKAYDHMVANDYRLTTDFLILLYTVLIVANLKKPLSYAEALALVHPKAPRAERAPELDLDLATTFGADVDVA